MIRARTNKSGTSVGSSDVSSRERTTLVAALVGPTLLAIGWGVLAPGSGPAQAFADPSTADAADASPLGALRSPTDEETQALRHCIEACASIADIEPPTLIPGQGEIVVDEQVDDEDEQIAAGFNLRITSILRDGDGNPAVFIDGAFYHEGDAVHAGWSIDSIDLPTRTVTISNPDAEQPVTLSPGR